VHKPATDVKAKGGEVEQGPGPHYGGDADVHGYSPEDAVNWTDKQQRAEGEGY